MAQCSSIKTDGDRCTRRGTNDGLCGTHWNSRHNKGPHKYEKMQLKNVHAKQVKDLWLRIVGDAPGGATRDRVMQYNAQLRPLREAHQNEIREMELRHYREIMQTGVNPDREADERRNARNAERRNARIERPRAFMEIVRAREQERIQRDIRIAEYRRIVNEIHGAPDAVQVEAMNMLRRLQEFEEPVVPQERNLRDFVNDGQNVHTTEAVKQTKDIIAKVRTISVPEGYRWNKSYVSPTIGEIISECKLTAHAAAQMFNKYVSPETIYDMEEGIYGKVLDCVWQFIKNSSDKADMCKIMKQELEDNIGMCAQGNLSRICNVLAGYMDGVGSQESLSERLGRLFPPLMDIDDDDERRRQAESILTENAVPRDQWGGWMDAVMV